MDERLHKLKEMTDKGIDEITSKGVFNKETACLAGEMVDILKDISTIEAMEEAGYSETYPRYYMDDGMSYARRGRDGDGDGRYSERYSRRGNSYGYESYGRGRGYSRRGYSRDDGKEEMIEHLEHAMRKATTEQERQSIQRMIEQAENG